MDRWEHQITVNCHHCQGFTEHAYKRDEKNKRNIDRNFRLCMKCVENRSKLRKRSLNADISILQLLITKRDGDERPAYLKPVIRENKTKQSWQKFARS